MLSPLNLSQQCCMTAKTSPVVLLVCVCLMQATSGRTVLGVLGTVSRFHLLQHCHLICALAIAFFPSVVKDLKTTALCLIVV